MSTSLTRVLVTGVDGQVGSALLAALPARHAALGVGRAQLDLAQPEAIPGILDALQPDAVVNCAAYTAVDRAESERDLAFAVNGAAPGAMARWCAAHDRPMVQLSTDYVFAGDAARPYREDDPIAPLGVYGASKAEGERQVAAAGGRHVILRTAWVYAANGKNFVRTMLRLGAERDELGVVNDQRGCPTAAANIAQAVCHILDGLVERRGEVGGVYHYVDAGETTWYGLAEAIFAAMAPRWGRRPRLKPLTTAEYPTPARRPAYSVLDTARFRAGFPFVPPRWQDSLAAVLAELAAGEPAGPA